MTSDRDVNEIYEDEAGAYASARHGDMRVQIVLRELNQGALAGFRSEITEQAALMIIAALDSFDYAAVNTAFGEGFHLGRLFEQVRRRRAGGR